MINIEGLFISTSTMAKFGAYIKGPSLMMTTSVHLIRTLATVCRLVLTVSLKSVHRWHLPCFGIFLTFFVFYAAKTLAIGQPHQSDADSVFWIYNYDKASKSWVSYDQGGISSTGAQSTVFSRFGDAVALAPGK